MDDQEQMLGSLLPFHKRIVEELISEDGLCIMSAGMGWQKVIQRLTNPDEHGVVLILSATEWQKQMIVSEMLRLDPGLQADGAAAEGASSLAEGIRPELPHEVTNETLSQARIDLYATKACLFITTRILVVDQLNKRIEGKQIAGIIVMNAHRVTDSSQDGFAVRLFRESNKEGFIRAFSDQPVSFTTGFAKVEKIMRALFIRKLHLWPRFESSCKDVLDAVDKEIQVTELEVFMSPSMAEIYHAIAELMDVCIKELRKSNKIDTSQLTLEKGIFRNFDDIIRRQLDSVWHTVNPRTKQIVGDLKTLRTLAEHLLSFDPVTFLAYLDNLRITDSVNTIWMFHAAANSVFDQAKRRVYQVRVGGMPRAQKTGSPVNKKAKLDASSNAALAGSTSVHPVLEPLPKWDLVQEVMEEVQKERLKTSQAASTSGRETDGEFEMAPVLIVANETRTCLQLRAILQAGGSKKILQQLYSEYLLRQLDKKKEAAKGGRGGGNRGGRHGRGRGRRIEELRAQRLQHTDKAEQDALMSIAQGLAAEDSVASRGKGRGTGTGKRGKRKGPQAESPERNAESSSKADAQEEEDAAKILENVHFLALEGKDTGLLWQVRPAYIIVHDPDVSFVRQIEVYKAETRDKPMKVYNLWYSKSLESDRYMATLNRENTVFEDLIQQKAFMVFPEVAQDLGRLVVREPKERPSAMHPDVVLGIADTPHGNPNAITRRGGAMLKQVKPKDPTLVVDVREFMSSLPAVLYQQGLTLLPVTLEVGDYILSPEMCVERKSLSDLRQSFTSGRLFHQAESMSRHYETPILLIEFDRDKAFILHSPADISADIQVNSLISKIVVLTLHFPRLRFIWSRSLHASADIYRSLKSNQDEPDPAQAAAVGVPTAGEGGATGGESLINTTAVDLLRRLPGVNESNFRPLMAAGGSLAGIAAMPVEDLEKAMGGRLPAKKLRDWLDAVCPRL